MPKLLKTGMLSEKNMLWLTLFESWSWKDMVSKVTPESSTTGAVKFTPGVVVGIS